jgi:Tetratricopeptide repeat.
MNGVLGMMLLASLALPVWLQQFVRPTNSRAAASAGVKQYSKKDFKGAVESFHQADSIDPSPVTAYDLGTARIAAGNGKGGSQELERALKDVTIRPDALFNRGNAKLDAKEYEQAISDYKESLRLRSSDAGAKRNLEIALRRRQEQQQQQSRQNQQQQQRNQQQQKPQNQQKQDQGQQEKQDKGNSQTDALLRSIAQQEREELERMRKQGSTPRRIGW